MMPIKGTKARVKPGQCVCVPGKGCEGKKPGSEDCLAEGRRVDIERGQQLQADLKERAENLMVSARVAKVEGADDVSDRRFDPVRPPILLFTINGDGAQAHCPGELRCS